MGEEMGMARPGYELGVLLTNNTKQRACPQGGFIFSLGRKEDETPRPLGISPSPYSIHLNLVCIWAALVGGVFVIIIVIIIII